MDFSEVARTWLDCVRLSLSPSTMRNYAVSVRRFLELIPDARARPATRADLLAFRARRAELVLAGTVNRELRAIRACLRWAEENELPHPSVPTRRLLIVEPETDSPAYDEAERARLLEAASIRPGLLAVFRIADATGLRATEIRGLVWADVSPEGWLRVRHAKTRAGQRDVYAPELVAWLAAYRRTLRHRGEDDPVAQRDVVRGLAWEERTLAEHVMSACRYAGVRIRKRPLHAFRHTVAADLVRAGAPIHAAQKHLGHASPTTTLKIYARAQRQDVEDAGAALERFRRQRRDS